MDYENKNAVDVEYEYKINKDILELTHTKENRKYTLKRIEDKFVKGKMITERSIPYLIIYLSTSTQMKKPSFIE